MVESVSIFSPGRMSWKGKEYFITKVENINDEFDIVSFGGQGEFKEFNSKSLEDEGAEMIEIGAVSPEVQERRRISAEEARERIINNAAFLVEKSATEAGATELENWVDEEGIGLDDKDYVLRTMDGEGALVAYEDKDDLGDKIVNALKTDYSKGHMLNYLDARPITFTRWKGLPMERKLSSRRDNEDEE